MAKQAVLLLAHGTPETVEQVPEYLLKVTSGRPLPQSVVEEIQHRYSLIGRSPLTEITFELACLVEARASEPSISFLVWAARGQALAPAHDLLLTAAAGRVEEATRCAALLGRVGASSGADLCLGIQLALDHLPPEATPPRARPPARALQLRHPDG